MPNINIDDAYILGETGAQVDKVTGLFTKDEDTTSGEKAFAQLNIGTAGSNRNLLDNPFFTAGNVVNQRGFSSSSTEGYTVDRWKLLRSNIVTATLGNDGMTISKSTTGYAFFSQYIGRAIDLEANYTLSVMTSDGQVYSATRKFVNGTSSETYVSIGGMNVGFGLYGKDTTPHAALYFGTSQTGSLTVKAMKLELGSVSTLANDAPPEYGEELRKCMRYFVRYESDPVGNGYISSDRTNVYLHCPTGVQMRAVPTAVISGSLQVRAYNQTIAVQSVYVYAQPQTEGVTLRLVLSSQATATGPASAYFNSSGQYIDLSADL